ncbi:alpha-D-glucose phosphate-specific phosphoglucomutase [Loktanella sp. F6476L]|uniref:alpha-D-glucose phosphate-specific phosphoglucomutase n=1 Tax=Loktanella sp. F6476L TaxID=2926405 RepID=UPI001FF2445F|nr:alpha-D-glucose phosphate-specific phosphoglucomutase [Loktanella sp. F6476L]MCK0120665.1 alpha-D-glucose phosphate-specific phosphoglucomutase [Loktanella sp. F6476L]
MTRKTVQTAPIDGQKPGTSGLRKKARVFMEPHYLENFVQSIFDGIGGVAGKTLVVGGDGRFHNDVAVRTILRMAAANGAAKAIVGQGGLLSTPAASHLIRLHKTDGGIILSASHNPGGIDEDFGIKFNTPNGGPAPEAVTDAIFERTTTIDTYHIWEGDAPDIDQIGDSMLGEMAVQIVDPVSDYADLMETLFDFGAIRALFADNFTMQFDAMNAITGPYGREILENRLGAPKGTVVHGTPQPDFGGMHPDPNPTWAHELMDTMFAEDGPDFGAASDGDGDRNMIVGHQCYVSPSDSLAVIAAHATVAPGYKDGLSGVARSMPTSAAVDRVAKSLDLTCFETPTGWKFFGNLMDHGQVALCGEESFGAGSDHIREKDGLWAVLMWLNIIAATGQGVAELLKAHWAVYGRNYYSRHDFEAIPTEQADIVFNGLRDKQAGLVGQVFAGLTVTAADEFSYNDPVDGSVSHQQGLRVMFGDGTRFVLRKSGTGTTGATLRLYLEALEEDPAKLDQDAQAALADVIAAAHAILGMEAATGRSKPDVIT